MSLLGCLILFSVSQVNARSLYCITTTSGVHCYISPNPCRNSLPPHVTCEELDVEANYSYDWNDWLMSNGDYVIKLETFDGDWIQIMDIYDVISEHDNSVYTVDYVSGSDKVVVKVLSNDTSSNVLQAIENPTQIQTFEVQNITELRADGETIIAPNPYSTSTTVELNFDGIVNNATLVFKAYTLAGVLKYTKSNAQNKSTFTIGSGDLARATYIYKVFYGDYEISSGTFIRTN